MSNSISIEKNASPVNNQVLQLKINLKDSTPNIYRIIYFPANANFMQLHTAIQLAMGWNGHHLYQFYKERETYIGLPEEHNEDILDIRETNIDMFLKNEKDSITYEYDFGNSWEHDVVVEKVLDTLDVPYLPYCKTAKMACPFEDCGGVWGYMHVLQVLKNPKHKDFKEINECYGNEEEEFDPTFVDIEDINAHFEDFENYYEDMLDQADEFLN
jgi:hypothetical protein